MLSEKYNSKKDQIYGKEILSEDILTYNGTDEYKLRVKLLFCDFSTLR